MAYNNTPVALDAGTGFLSGVTTGVPTDNATYINSFHALRLPPGTHTISKVKFTCAGNVAHLKLKVFRMTSVVTGVHWTYIGESEDIGGDSVGGVIDKTLTTPIANVMDGDNIGFWVSDATHYDHVKVVHETEAFGRGLRLYYKAGDITANIDDLTDYQDMYFPVEVTLSTNQYIAGVFGDKNATLYNISPYTPYGFDLAAWPEPYYVVFNQLDIDEDEAVKIEFCSQTATGGKTVEFGFQMAMNAGVYSKISYDLTGAVGSFDPTKTKDLAGEETAGNNFNVYVWIDPVNKLWELIYVNRVAGQGGNDAADYEYISLMDRVPQSYTGSGPIKRIAATCTGTIGINYLASVRKPVIIGFDSWTAAANLEPAKASVYLSYVPTDTDNSDAGESFTEQRWPIIWGIGGNPLLTNGTYGTAAMTRFDGDEQDVCSFKNAVHVLVVNGINDGGGSGVVDNDAEAQTVSTNIANAVGTIIAKMRNNANDVVVLAANGFPPDSITAKPILKTFTGYLAKKVGVICDTRRVPFINAYSLFPDAYFVDTDDPHPTDTDGSAFLAKAIAEYYEKNIKGASGGGWWR